STGRRGGGFADEALDAGEMILPERRAPLREPRHLGSAPRRRFRRIIEDRRPPAGAVERVEIFGYAAAGFAQRRNVAAQGRDTDRERLDQREAEALSKGRQQQGTRAFEQQQHLAIG